MSKIKEYQQKKKNLNDENAHAENNKDNFQKKFSDHMTYLNSVITENKLKKKKKKEKKLAQQNESIQPPIQEGIDIKPMETASENVINNNKTSIIIHANNNAPPYSCLKNSSKPTYRQWQKSLKEKFNDPPQSQQHITTSQPTTNPIIQPTANQNPNPILIRQEKLENIKNKNKKMKKVKIRKTTFKLGKHKDRVSVLIKNRRTRKKLKKECNLLKKKNFTRYKRIFETT